MISEVLQTLCELASVLMAGIKPCIQSLRCSSPKLRRLKLLCKAYFHVLDDAVTRRGYFDPGMSPKADTLVFKWATRHP
jgi:hypothetical protein